MRPFARLTLTLALVLVAGSAEAGVRRSPALTTDYSITVWGIADGLLPFSVRAITQTADGYLWARYLQRALPFRWHAIHGVYCQRHPRTPLG